LDIIYLYPMYKIRWITYQGYLK